MKHANDIGANLGFEAQLWAAAYDSEPFVDRTNRPAAQSREQQAGGAGPDAAITENLKTLGFGERLA